VFYFTKYQTELKVLIWAEHIITDHGEIPVGKLQCESRRIRYVEYNNMQLVYSDEGVYNSIYREESVLECDYCNIITRYYIVITSCVLCALNCLGIQSRDDFSMIPMVPYITQPLWRST